LLVDIERLQSFLLYFHSNLRKFIKRLKYELVDVEIINYKKYPNIRDIDDLPVLANAIESKVDLLITGDKDFDDVMIDKPKILKPRMYLDEYMK
jgi:predicted nucleic acid-binding protein